jgi:hypothetical protein
MKSFDVLHGENHPSSSYTESKIRAVYLDRQRTGDSYTKLAKRHGVNQSVIKKVCNKLSWVELTNRIDREIQK